VPHPVNGAGPVQGNGMTTLECVLPQTLVDAHVNLLNTFPVQWLPCSTDTCGVKTLGESVIAFDRLWKQLSYPMRAWFNALFWNEPRRLHQFVVGPASLKHHHNGKHGLFIHSVDCAIKALRLAQDDDLVNKDVLLMAALLHDLGKAEEYERDATGKGWKLSERGVLIGHRMSTHEWMSAAYASLPPEQAPVQQQVMAVYHAINACHAPDWVGLRSPRTPEAFYLSSVDGLSGHCDLIRTTSQPGQREGRYHHAFRGSVYLTPACMGVN